MDYGASIVYLLDGDILEAVARCDVYIIQTTALMQNVVSDAYDSESSRCEDGGFRSSAGAGWLDSPPSNSFG